MGPGQLLRDDHPKDELRFGKGGVDDAEDAEVILHEYGHAIHEGSGFTFASEEAGAISEGFGDYWAVDFADIVARRLGVPERTPLACVMDWDATSYTSDVPHCLRRLDEDLQYPEDLDGEVHDDGRIWSHALFDIRQSLGYVTADTVFSRADQLRRHDDDRPRDRARSPQREPSTATRSRGQRSFQARGFSSESAAAALGCGRYQPRVSSSSSGASAAADRPLIASPSPRDTRARISASL